MGRNGQKAVRERYNWEGEVVKLGNLYDGLLGRGPNGTARSRAMEPESAAACDTAQNLPRRMERCRALGIPCELLRGQIFKRSGAIVETGLPEGIALKPAECRNLLATLGGAIVLWTDGRRPANEPSEWYTVICRRFKTMPEHTSKFRRMINYGLRNCRVRRISPEELADRGYPVYRAAVLGYGGQAPVDEADFRRGVLREAPYPDLWQNWGVFAEERMVGYAQVELFGTVCAGFSSIKYDPAALKLYSGYALIHTMNQYYLEVMGVQYVCNGARSISHETNMHEFLVRNFGFEKVYTNLNLYYRWPLGWIVALAYPFRGALGRAVPPLEKILRLEQFRRGPVKA